MASKELLAAHFICAWLHNVLAGTVSMVRVAKQCRTLCNFGGFHTLSTSRLVEKKFVRAPRRLGMTYLWNLSCKAPTTKAAAVESVTPLDTKTPRGEHVLLIHMECLEVYTFR